MSKVSFKVLAQFLVVWLGNWDHCVFLVWMEKLPSLDIQMAQVSCPLEQMREILLQLIEFNFELGHDKPLEKDHFINYNCKNRLHWDQYSYPVDLIEWRLPVSRNYSVETQHYTAEVNSLSNK